MSLSVSATVRTLYHTLQRSIGREEATLELKWMQDSLQSAHPAKHSSRPTLETMLARRVAGEPLQYILGTQPFGPLNLLTRAPVLIPRPETEDWTLRLAKQLSPSRDNPISILDLCTGSGCIPLLLCHLAPPGSVHATGVDVSEDAIRLAKDNANVCDIEVLADDVVPPAQHWRNTFTPLLANIRDPAFSITSRLRPPYDVLTSNPPYIRTQEYATLPPSVKDFEDPRALIGDLDFKDEQGLSFYRTIADLLGNTSLRLSKPGALVALEVGEGQAQDVADIMSRKAQIRDIEIWKDPWDKERVVFGRSQT